jgi:hypothetical protein
VELATAQQQESCGKAAGKLRPCVVTQYLTPLTCLQTFFVDDDLKESCQLDAVLCMVDAKHITQHLEEVKPEGVVNEAGGDVGSRYGLIAG